VVIRGVAQSGSALVGVKGHSRWEVSLLGPVGDNAGSAQKKAGARLLLSTPTAGAVKLLEAVDTKVSC
jgi:hypothetical protein